MNQVCRLVRPCIRSEKEIVTRHVRVVPPCIKSDNEIVIPETKFPKKVFLLQGNHESALITRINGFYEECKRRFNIKTWK